MNQISSVSSWQFIFLLLCVVTLDIRANASRDVPTILEHPLDSIVLKDDPVTMKCRASGPGVTYIWYKNNTELKNDKNSLVLSDGSLFLVRASGADGGHDSELGSYYCNASNEYGFAISNTATVRIAMLKSEFRINPQATQAVVGSKVTLSCLPPRGLPEPVVSWKKGDNILRIQEEGRMSIHPAGDLVINNLQRSDAGIYICSATNMVGTVNSTSATLIVQELPYFLKKPKNETVQEGSSVDFHCAVQGEPLPKISWRKLDGNMPIGRAELKPEDNIAKYASQTLSIKKVRITDAGTYVCQAKNVAGTVESLVQLSILTSPLLSKLPQNQTVKSGYMATFSCEASGDPKPEIVWTKDSDPTFTKYVSPDSNERVYVNGFGSLVINNAQLSDGGFYTCVAMNSVTSVMGRAMLEVVDDAAINAHLPPIIEHGPQNQTLMLKDMAILPCRARGRLTPNISWFHNGQRIEFFDLNKNPRFELLATGALRISSLTKSDTGIYICHAQNTDGFATWAASLSIENHTNPNAVFHRMDDISKFPSRPGKPKVTDISPYVVDIEWQAPDKMGSSIITNYLIQYWSPDFVDGWHNVGEDITVTKFKAKNLKPGSTYFFIVRAENKHGISLPSKPSEPITIPIDYSLQLSSDGNQSWNRVASSHLVKVTGANALNYSAIELKWEMHYYEPLVNGFYVKWKGPPATDTQKNWLNVTDAKQSSYIITGLKPFTYYEFFLVPYHNNILGKPSNVIGGTTLEAPPSQPPVNVRVRMTASNTVHVMWKPPPKEYINGVLKGYQVSVSSNFPDHPVRNITTNERANSITLFNLVQDATYRISIAAENAAGIGAFHTSDPIVINNATLQRHLKIISDELERQQNKNFFERNQLKILATVVVMVLLTIAMIAAIFFFYQCRHQNEKAGGSTVLFNPTQQPFSENFCPSHHYLDATGYAATLSSISRRNEAQNENQTFHFSPSESTYSQILDGNGCYSCNVEDTGPLYSVGYCAMIEPYQTKTPPIPTCPPPALMHNHHQMHKTAQRNLGMPSDNHFSRHTVFPNDHEMIECSNALSSSARNVGSLRSRGSSHNSDSTHTEVSVLNSHNNSACRKQTLNRASPPRNILDVVPPPPPVDKRFYKTLDSQKNGAIYMQPQGVTSADSYIPIATNYDGYPNPKSMQRRKRYDRCQSVGSDGSPCSSLIATEMNDDLNETAFFANSDEKEHMSDLVQTESQTELVDPSAQRRVPIMGRKAAYNKSTT